MAALSGLTPTLLPKSHVHGVGTAFYSSSLVRLHGVGAVVDISRRSSLIQTCRCEVGSDDAVSLHSDHSVSLSSSISALERLNTSAAADRYTRERRSIVAIGLSVHSAPVEIREKLAIPEAKWPQAIGELCKLQHIVEAAVLSTCNRIEIYVLSLSQYLGVKQVTHWISKSSGVPISELCKHRVLLYNKDAIEHLFEVSSGLDSLVLGECQILAQVKQVSKVGQNVVGFGKIISMLFKSAISVGKRVRTETGIASGAVSVSSAAVELAMMKLPESSHAMARMLVVGAGKMGKLVIKHLVDKGCKKMVVVNRSEDSVVAIRREMKDIEIMYKPLSEMYDCAAIADVVFTCTASKSPLFLKQHVEILPPARQVGDLRLFIDISVPRNVGSCVANLGTARVYNVDDLKQVVEANKEDRLREAMKARSIIHEETKQFEDWRDSLGTVSTIKKLRAFGDLNRVTGLDICLSKFGDDITKRQRKAIEDYGRYMLNKFLNGPMRHLRCDWSENRSMKQVQENMHALIRMFNLETDD